MRRPANPLRGKTTNWLAVCGKSACTVRREGGLKPISSPYPYTSVLAALGGDQRKNWKNPSEPRLRISPPAAYDITEGHGARSSDFYLVLRIQGLRSGCVHPAIHDQVNTP